MNMVCVCVSDSIRVCYRFAVKVFLDKNVFVCETDDLQLILNLLFYQLF